MEARKIACFGAAAFVGSMLVGTVASPVHAQAHHPLTVTGHPDEMTRVVPYGDLSLATSEGRKILMRRVGYAVDEICMPSEVNGGSLDVPYCISTAWASARPQIKTAFARRSPEHRSQ